MMIRTKGAAVFSLILIATMLLNTAILASSVNAASSQASDATLVLSNEAPGHGITALVNAGYGDYSIYHVLLYLQQDSDPSLARIITLQFLDTLHTNEPECSVFTTQLKDVNSSAAIAIGSDATVKTINIYGSNYQNVNGVSTFDTDISGVGSFRAVYTSPQTPLTSFTAEPNGVEATYNVFAILYMPNSTSSLSPTSTPLPKTSTSSLSPTSTPLPKTVAQDFPEWAIMVLLVVAIMIITVVLVARKKRSKSNSS